MPATGYIQVHAYTSNARLPLEGASIAITDMENDILALRLTNRSGQLDVPIAISVPEPSAGQTPDTGIIPYALVNLYARAENYEMIEALQVQVFPQTVTDQDLEMIPLSELPDSFNQAQIFRTPPQNL